MSPLPARTAPAPAFIASDFPSAAPPAAGAPSAEPATPEALRLLAERDPVAAARWLAARPVPGDRWPWLEQIALAWAEIDADAALAWARAETDATLRPALLLAIAGELVRTRPLEALHAALGVAASPARDQVLRRAVAEWAARDAFAAAQWVWDATDDTLRADLLSGLILAVAEQDPATAFIMAEDDLSPGRARDDVLVSVLQRWAQHDPAHVQDRLRQWPESALKTAALQSLPPPK